MPNAEDYLALSDEQLLAQCDVHIYKSSGPGGQHRNKVSSAVRLRHRPTEISAHGDDSRSQHDNKAMAMRRLRMAIACRVRGPVAAEQPPPPVVQECMFTPRGRPKGATELPPGARRLEVGRKDHRYCRVAAWLLDVLEAHQGRLAEAAAHVGITGGNLTSVLKDDRHVFAAAQDIRKRYAQKPLT